MPAPTEDAYLRLQDEHMHLKKKCNEQEGTIKRMFTKLKMIDENLRRRQGGEGIDGIGSMAGGTGRAGRTEKVEDEVLRLRSENSELRRKCTSLTERCRALTLQKQKKVSVDEH